MANTFYTPEQAAEVAHALVQGELRYAPTASLALSDSFLPGRGKTVEVKIPGALVARARNLADVTNKIILDAISEITRPITLSTHAYSAVGLSEEDLSLNLEDFARQVLKPQGEAVAEYVEATVLDVLTGLPETTGIAWDAANPVKTLTAIRRALKDNGVDPTKHHVVVVAGGNVVDALFDSGDLDASKTGDASALREGVIGKIRGMEIMEAGSEVDADDVIAYASEGLYLVAKPPAAPQGAAFVATSSAKGVPVRYLRDYDADYTQDRSIVSTMVGAGFLPFFRADRTQQVGMEGGGVGYTAPGVTLTEIANAGAIRVNIATV